MRMFEGPAVSGLTHKLILDVPHGDLVVHLLVSEEVEGLKRVEKEVAQVLVHVDGEDTAVKAVDGAAAVHDLWAGGRPLCKGLVLCFTRPWTAVLGSGCVSCAGSHNVVLWEDRGSGCSL